MTKLTVQIDDTLLQRASAYAAQRDMTVARLVRQHLELLVGEESAASDRAGSARDRLLKLIDESPGRMGPGWKFDRASIHER
ncbi:MAG TPA: DUF6364 family protein [Hyphomicrobiales bacterium]|nr:DUF6364 family protein [Hyphomicrobiales bacterium]